MAMTVETGLDRLADAVAFYEPSTCQREVARLRVADALFSYQQGRALPVARLVDDLLGPASSFSPPTVAFELAACIRYTEIDDLMLTSCVSPGAIVIPTILSIAAMDASGSFDHLLDAAVVGYGVAEWLGGSLDGARAVVRGEWPSRAVAPLTAALCAGRALGLDRSGLVDAATLASIWRADGRLGEPARELSFARAVSLGVEAAQATACGVRAHLAASHGRPLDREPPDTPASPTTVFDRAVLDARVKLFCAARQAMPALVAVMRALASAGITDPTALEAIELELPEACAAMVDLPRVTTRVESLRSVQYQLAALLLSPEKLWDLDRSELPLVPHAEALAPSVSVRAAIDLEAAFPARWPARATVRAGRAAATVLVADDPPERLDAAYLQAKQHAFCGKDMVAGALAAGVLEACVTSKAAGEAWSLVGFIAEATGGEAAKDRQADRPAARRRLGPCR